MNSQPGQNSDLLIAYNIAVKDASGKSNYEIFTINIDGSNPKNITNHPDVAWTYMSYKKDLYFISDRDTCTRCYFLYKSDVNGKNVEKVSNLQLEDSWMDTRNADGTNAKQLTTYPKDNISKDSNGYKAGATQWHPTENFISYISMQDGRHSIFALMPDGSKQWKLTTNNFSEGWHDWSDDGNWITFDMANPDESQYHIMLMNWKTKEVKKLTDSTHKYQQVPVFILK